MESMDKRTRGANRRCWLSLLGARAWSLMRGRKIQGHGQIAAIGSVGCMAVFQLTPYYNT